MKQIFLIIAMLFLSVEFNFAFSFNPTKKDTLTGGKSYPKSSFYEAQQNLVDMLSGKSKLDYERAVFLTENAYFDNSRSYEVFQQKIDENTYRILKFAFLNMYSKNIDTLKFKSTLLETKDEKVRKYRNDLLNWAIFQYMTDTVCVLQNNLVYRHLPYNYSYSDPLGSLNWKNSQVMNLIGKNGGEGNCYAMSSLFKILSERLQTAADIATAPGHIFIQHQDIKGTTYNIELASKSFVGTGSIETLTYSTDRAVKNGISMRTLDLKQSVAMCLVYLAKGYEHKYDIKDDNFILSCADLALKFDSLNLNAMLLKAEVMEERIINLMSKNNLSNVDGIYKFPVIEKQFREYEGVISFLYDKGYKEMPIEMKNIILSKLSNDNYPIILQNHTPQPFKHIGKKEERYATLSGGIFDELIIDKPIEKISRTVFSTKTRKIQKFIPRDSTYSKYNIDPVVFAWSIDPLASKYPHISPYSAFEGNPIYFNDPTGKDAAVTIDAKSKSVVVQTTIYIYGAGATQAIAGQMQTDIMGAWNKGWTYTDKNGQAYNVKFNVTVQMYNPADASASPGLFSGANNPWNTDNYIQVNANDKTSFVRGGDEGEWRGQGRNGQTFAQDNPAPHEFGHILGLMDRYLKGGGTQAGWAGNIMAEPAMMGAVEQKNIDAIMSNVFTNDYYNFVSDYNGSLQANQSNSAWSQWLGVPYIHNNVNSTYNTKIDEGSMNWECSDETDCE